MSVEEGGREGEGGRADTELKTKTPHVYAGKKSHWIVIDFLRFFKFLLEKISWNYVEIMPKTNKMWMILIILSLFGMKKTNSLSIPADFLEQKRLST